MVELKNDAGKLYGRFEDIYSSRNMLFLGDAFNFDTDGQLLELKWNTIYTSIRDTKRLLEISNKVKNNSRKCTIIGPDIFLNTSDFNRLNAGKALVNALDLKLVKLFDEAEEIGRPQWKTAEKILRNAGQYLNANGALFCVGFTQNDPLKTDTFMDAFYEKADDAFPQCIYIFGANEEFEKEACLGKVLKNPVFTAELLPELWSGYLNDNDDFWDEEFDEPTEDDDLQIFINQKSVFIPRENVRETAPFAELLEYRKIYGLDISMPYRIWFANFLKNDTNIPKWYGYRNDFNIKREFETELKEITDRSLKNTGELKYRPILLHGQSGSGKTIALGNLAYKIFAEKQYPVIYITNPDVSFISDSSATESENSNFEALIRLLRYLKNEKDASSVLLVWDCSGLDKERKNYLKLYRKLRMEFGLNVILVCTSYALNQNKSVTDDVPNETAKVSSFYDISTDEIPTDNEIDQLRVILRKKAGVPKDELNIIVETLNNGIKKQNDYASSFLAMLYYVFWEIRENLSMGVRREFSTVLKNLNDAEKDQPILSSLALSDFNTYKEELTKLSVVSDTEHKNDNFTIFLSLFTYYNKEISSDLMYNLLDIKNDFDTISRILSAPMFVVHEYAGDIKYRIRTKLEAEMLLNTFGINVKDKKTIVKYLLKMLYYIELNQFGVATSEAIELITKIISAIGPNGDISLRWGDKIFFRYVPYFIAELERAKLSTNNDPRLIVQEFALAREYYNFCQKSPEFVITDYESFTDLFEEVRYADDPISFYFSREKYNLWPKSLIENNSSFDASVEETRDELDVYRKQIKIERANFLLSVGQKENNYERIKQAAALGRTLIRENAENSYAVVIYLRANNCLLEKKLASDTQKLLSDMMSFALEVMQSNPELIDDEYFTKECVKLFGGETAQEFAQNIGKSSPTPAMICCHIYAKCWEKDILAYNKVEHRIQWAILKNDPNKSKELDEIFDELNSYSSVIESDPNCLNLYLQLYWLKCNKYALNFRDEKQHTYMDNRNWSNIINICERIKSSTIATIQQKPAFILCNYIRALAYAQLGEFSNCVNIMRSEVKTKINGVIIKHIICEPNGQPRKFSGINVKMSAENKSHGSVDIVFNNTPVVKGVRFNKASFSSYTDVITNNSDINKLMLGLNFIGLNALGYQEKR